MWLKVDMILGRVREKDEINTTSVPKLFSWEWDPDGSITATKAGDEYIDTLTWTKYYAQQANNSSWVEINYMSS